jgi:hypothetical protein
MLITTNPPSIAGQTTLVRSAGWRESVARQDRLAQDQRIDTPEIQQSYRVSFSSQVRVDAAGVTRGVVQAPVDFEAQSESPALRAYRQVAAL